MYITVINRTCFAFIHVDSLPPGARYGRPRPRRDWPAVTCRRGPSWPRLALTYSRVLLPRARGRAGRALRIEPKRVRSRRATRRGAKALRSSRERAERVCLRQGVCAGTTTTGGERARVCVPRHSTNMAVPAYTQPLFSNRRARGPHVTVNHTVLAILAYVLLAKGIDQTRERINSYRRSRISRDEHRPSRRCCCCIVAVRKTGCGLFATSG